MADLFALTEHQPWGTLIVAGLKPIENRTWPLPQWMIGQPLAIHAGKTYDREGEQWVRRNFVDLKWPAPVKYSRTSAILGVVRVTGVITAEKRLHEQPGVVMLDQALLSGLVTAHDMPWFNGEYGLVLRDSVLFQQPVPCRGFQKLWRVPQDALPAVREQFRVSRPQKVVPSHG